MPTTQPPHIIRGTVTGINGVVEGATVTGTIGSITTTAIGTNSKGRYILTIDANQFTDGWTAGTTVITLLATKTGEGSQTVELVIEAAPQTQDFTLSQISDLFYYESEQNGYPLRFNLLVDYEGNKISQENPLSVENVGSSSDFDLINNPSTVWTITNNDGQPEDETITLANGDVYKRTFTYSTVSGMRIMTARSAWQKQ